MLDIWDTIWNRKTQRSRRQRQAHTRSVQVKPGPSWAKIKKDFSLFDQLLECDSPRLMFREETGLLARHKMGCELSPCERIRQAFLESGALRSVTGSHGKAAPPCPQLHWIGAMGREISDGHVCSSLCYPCLTGFISLCSFLSKNC